MKSIESTHQNMGLDGLGSDMEVVYDSFGFRVPGFMDILIIGCHLSQKGDGDKVRKQLVSNMIPKFCFFIKPSPFTTTFTLTIYTLKIHT